VIFLAVVRKMGYTCGDSDASAVLAAPRGATHAHWRCRVPSAYPAFTATCKVCGASYRTPPSEAARRATCSGACRRIYLSKADLPCAECGLAPRLVRAGGRTESYCAACKRRHRRESAARSNRRKGVPLARRRTIAERRAAKRAQDRRYYVRHLDEQRRKRRVYWRRRYDEEPEYFKNSDHRHRARKNGARVIDFTARDWELVKLFYGFRCAYCGCTPRELCRDHVVALARGGDHTLLNVVPACRRCNSRKHTKVWLPLWPRPRDWPYVVATLTAPRGGEREA
jgi:hypothetical protein